MNPKHRLLRIGVALLSLMLCITMLSSCGVINIILVLAAPTTSSDSFSGELEYERPDFEAIQKAFVDVTADLNNGSNSIFVQKAVSDAYGMYNDAYTQYSIVQIRFYTDVNDSEAEDEINYCAEQFSLLDPIVNDLYLAIIENGFTDTYLSGWSTNEIAYIYVREKMFDDEYSALITERTELENSYMSVSAKTTVNYNYIDYTMDEIYDMYVDGKINSQKYQTLRQQYYRNLSAGVRSLYKRMIEIDNILAQKAECLSHIEYSYQYVYQRDFSAEDAEVMYEYVKEYIVPLYATVNDALDEDILADFLYDSDATIENYHDVIEKYVKEISPDMEKAYSDLMKHKLYTIGSSEGMQQAAFTTYLTSYEMPYMYIYTYGNLDDVNTFIHEFGHFYSYHLNGYESDNIIDVAEIQSQANEWLFMPYYDLDEEELEQYTLYRLANSLSAIIEGCLYDEFQQAMYKGEYTSVESLFESIADEYNYGSMVSEDIVEYVWAAIPHNFTSPFYYISYAVSAYPALEIYIQSLSDRQDAIDTYNEIVDETGYSTYLEVLEDADLNSPFDEGGYKYLSMKLNEIVQNTTKK